MRVRVLGSSAGGGLPQWNCGCERCVRARDGRLAPRRQPSIAVSADGQRWSLVNASPDVREQLAAFPPLHPRPGTRDLALDSIVLTNADLDHTIGLLVLRESLPYRVVATSWVRDALLEHNGVFRLLAPAFGTVKLDEPVRLDCEGRLEARLFPVPGKVPGWATELAPNHPEATCGVRITDLASGRRLVCVPGVRRLDSGTLAELSAATVGFVDGTFFCEDELSGARAGAPGARAMGHVPVSGDDGSLLALAALSGRMLYVHLNNTNPLVDPGSPEAEWVRAAGVEVARDGLELEL